MAITRYPRGSGMETAALSNLVLQHSAEIAALDVSAGGSGVSQAYVDGSLGARDLEITTLENYEVVQDGSISLNADNIAQLDASVVRIDGYFAGGYTGTFTADGSTVAVTDGLITSVTP